MAGRSDVAKALVQHPLLTCATIFLAIAHGSARVSERQKEGSSLATIERPTAYEVARLHWNAARAAHRALHAKLEGAKAAYAQISVPEDEDGSPACAS